MYRYSYVIITPIYFTHTHAYIACLQLVVSVTMSQYVTLRYESMFLLLSKNVNKVSTHHANSTIGRL